MKKVRPLEGYFNKKDFKEKYQTLKFIELM